MRTDLSTLLNHKQNVTINNSSLVPMATTLSSRRRVVAAAFFAANGLLNLICDHLYFYRATFRSFVGN